jgi:hypothetical protein
MEIFRKAVLAAIGIREMTKKPVGVQAPTSD